MTVVELLELGKDILKNNSDARFSKFASPTLDAEILLAHALEVTKPQLFSRLNFQISQAQEELFKSHIDRRLKHEPVAYITGKKYFFNRAFAVNRSVLIPRPDTETLVEEALKLFKLYDENNQKVRFIDVGTGSGAIAITLAAETYKSVIASDASAEALSIAQRNSDSLHTNDLIQFVQGNLLEPVIKILFDIKPEHTIVTANLPYLTTHQWLDTQPEIRDWEPKLALEAGYYGLDLYWVFFRQLAQNRKLFGESCAVLCEIDPSQEFKIQHLISESFP
jgi:release factor glutamine methyltransferase